MKKLILVLTGAAIAALGGGTANASVAPLSLQQAKTAARNAGWNFPTPGGVEKIKIQWTNRWSAWQVNLGVEADGQKSTRTWDPCQTLDSYTFTCYGGWDYSLTSTWAMATVDVYKSPRTGWIRTRVENNMSTWNGG